MSLYSLFVDLKANTADFVSGMSTASYAAKKAGRDIQDAFSGLGSIAERALEPFGAIGRTISDALNELTKSAGGSGGAFQQLGTLFGETGVASLEAAGGLAAVSAAAIGISVHAAEAAAQLYSLSQSTGVSVEALSALGYAAKATDVPFDAVVKGLEKMAKTAVAAAEAPKGTISAYSKLGVSLKDASGNMRDALDIFDQVADSFSKMSDGVEKGARAQQIFSRGGAALIPLMNEWNNGMREVVTTAIQLGAVMDGQTAAASEKLKTSITLLGAAVDGVSNEFLRQMLPGLISAADGVVNWAERNQKAFSWIISAVAGVADVFLVLGATIHSVIAETVVLLLDAAKQFADAFEGLWIATAQALTGNFSGAADTLKHFFGDAESAGRDFISHSEQIWKDYGHFVSQVYSNIKPGPGPTPKPGPVDQREAGGGESRERDTVSDLTSKLAAQVLAKAAGEADVKVTETLTNLNERLVSLQERQASVKAGPHPEQAARFDKQIEAVQQYIAELESDVPRIRQYYEQIAAAKDAVKINEKLDTETLQYERQIQALKDMSAAYQQGGAAIASAKIDELLEGDREEVGRLAQELALLSSQLPTDAVTFESWAASLVQLGQSLENAQQKVQTNRGLAEQTIVQKIQTQIDEQTNSLRAEAAAYDVVARAALSSSEAQIQAQAAGTAKKFAIDNPNSTPLQQEQVYKTTYDKLSLEREQTVVSTAAQSDLNYQYLKQIEELSEAKQVLEDYGQSTLTIDAEIYDAGVKNIDQWDQAALKVGDFTDKFRALANEIEEQGNNFGEKLFGAFDKAIDGAADSLAKFIVTGKSNFKQLFEGFSEQIIKASIQSSFAHLTSTIFGGPSSGEIGPGTVVGSTSAVGSLFPSGHGSSEAAAKSGPLGILAQLFNQQKPASSLTKRPLGTSTDPIYVALTGPGAQPSTFANSSGTPGAPGAPGVAGAYSAPYGAYLGSAGESPAPYEPAWYPPGTPAYSPTWYPGAPTSDAGAPGSGVLGQSAAAIPALPVGPGATPGTTSSIQTLSPVFSTAASAAARGLGGGLGREISPLFSILPRIFPGNTTHTAAPAIAAPVNLSASVDQTPAISSIVSSSTANYQTGHLSHLSNSFVSSGDELSAIDNYRALPAPAIAALPLKPILSDSYTSNSPTSSFSTSFEGEKPEAPSSVGSGLGAPLSYPSAAAADNALSPLPTAPAADIGANFLTPASNLYAPVNNFAANSAFSSFTNSTAAAPGSINSFSFVPPSAQAAPEFSFAGAPGAAGEPGAAPLASSLSILPSLLSSPARESAVPNLNVLREVNPLLSILPKIFSSSSSSVTQTAAPIAPAIAGPLGAIGGTTSTLPFANPFGAAAPLASSGLPFANPFISQIGAGAPSLAGLGSFGSFLQPGASTTATAPAAPSVGGSVASAVGGLVGGKSSGTAESPFYVIEVAGGAGGIGGKGGAGGAPGLGGILGGAGGGPDGSAANPFYVMSAQSLADLGGAGSGGDSGGGGLGGLLGLFGGGLAEGGDVEPGKFYLVGERHPEFFIPKQAGQISPSVHMSEDRGAKHISVQNHFHGISDMDSFNRSSAQITAQIYRTTQIAASRG